jgi:hypothetical protein
MNSREELETAFEEYRNGTFVKQEIDGRIVDSLTGGAG